MFFHTQLYLLKSFLQCCVRSMQASRWEVSQCSPRNWSFDFEWKLIIDMCMCMREGVLLLYPLCYYFCSNNYTEQCIASIFVVYEWFYCFLISFQDNKYSVCSFAPDVQLASLFPLPRPLPDFTSQLLEKTRVSVSTANLGTRLQMTNIHDCRDMHISPLFTTIIYFSTYAY